MHAGTTFFSKIFLASLLSAAGAAAGFAGTEDYFAGTEMLFEDVPGTNVPAETDAAGTEAGIVGDKNVPATQDEKMRWWRDAKFGMFIHYGLYSGLAGQWRGEPMGSEWIQRYAKVDTETYLSEALPFFRPKKNCAREWANLAKEAGCRYAVLTTKHHEGFALFDSRVSEFSSAGQIGRDLVKEFVEEFRKQNIKIGFYHSLLDWHQKDYDWTINPDLAYPEGQALYLKQKFIPRNQEAYKRYLAAQVRELLENYGKIDIIWWDYSQDAAEGDRAWGASDLIALCKELQPGIIMNNRLYSYAGLDPNVTVSNFDTRFGDFVTPEKHIPVKGYAGTDWESCMTVGDKWGFNRYDTNIKSPETVIRKLQECAGKGGNLLLNINPRADGSVPAKVALVFGKIGEWLRENGAAVYETKPFFDASDAAGTPLTATQSPDGNTIYVFVPAGTLPEELQVKIKGVPAKTTLLAETVCPVLVIKNN